MAREYILGGKNPPRAQMPKTKKGVKPTGWLEGEEPKPDGDYIPMHREQGDSFTFSHNGEQLTGAVQRSWKYMTLISGSDGEFYVEDTRKPANKQIRLLTDADRCTHCGHYFCTEDCPNYQQAEAYKMSKKNTINISDVLAIEPGDDDNAVWVNDVVNCVVTNVKEAKGNGPVKATLVNAEDNGDKITGIFWKRDFSKIERLEGKLVALEGGMIRSEYKPQKGPRIQQLAVQAKCEIEVIGESAHSDKPLPHKASPDRDTPENAPKRQETQSGGHRVTARKAIFEKFRLLGLVNKAYAVMKDEYDLPEMDGAALSTFATGVGISLSRGESLPESVFSDIKGQPSPRPAPKQESYKDGMEEENIPFEDAAPAKKPQSTERGLESWKTCAHPRRKNEAGEPLTIGEMTEADRLKYCRWAATVDEQPEGKGDKLFYANLKMLMASKGWGDPNKLLSLSFLETEGYGDSFTDEDINAYTQQEFSKDLDDLDEDEAVQTLSKFDSPEDDENVIKAILALKPKKATKPSKGKTQMPD